MVSIPIILVVGWELFGRWQGEVIRRKFGDPNEVARAGGVRGIVGERKYYDDEE